MTASTSTPSPAAVWMAWKLLASRSSEISTQLFNMLCRRPEPVFRLIISGMPVNAVSLWSLPGGGGNISERIARPSVLEVAGTGMIVAGEQHLAWWKESEETGEVDLAALITQFSALLYRVAFAVVRNAAEAEDVAQEVFVRVWEHRRKLPEVEQLRAWLVRIALNLALDYTRRARPAQMDEVLAETARSVAPGTEQQVMGSEELAR